MELKIQKYLYDIITSINSIYEYLGENRDFIVLPILSTTIGYFLVDLLLLNAFLNLGAGSVKSGLGYARACGATCLLLTGSEPKLFLHLR